MATLPRIYRTLYSRNLDLLDSCQPEFVVLFSSNGSLSRIERCASHAYYRTDWYRGNVLDLYSGCTLFESGPGQRLSSIRPWSLRSKYIATHQSFVIITFRLYVVSVLKTSLNNTRKKQMIRIQLYVIINIHCCSYIIHLGVSSFIADETVLSRNLLLYMVVP
jgi:hypothetical protein